MRDPDQDLNCIQSIIQTTFLKSSSNTQYEDTMIIQLGKVSIKKTLKVMEFSIQILPPPPPPPSMEKNIFFPQFFFMSLICFFSPNLARTLKTKLISASFKMFSGEKLKSKSLTNSRDFYPDPPNDEKLKSSVFWMN